MGYRVYGVEGGQVGAEEIRKKFGEDRLFYGWLEQIDFASLGKSNYFDAVTMVDFLEHVTDPNVALNIVNRILKEGGLCACYIPTTSLRCGTRESWNCRMIWYQHEWRTFVKSGT